MSLMIILKNRETRNIILFAAKSLKWSQEYKSVYLSPDLTEAQRTKFRQLVQIRDARNALLDRENREKKIWCIRENEVVQCRNAIH